MTTALFNDPIELATDVGAEKYLHVGEMSYPEMEISYLLACTKRAYYDDRPEARLRRHVLLYWERGFYKTSMLTSFLERCTASVESTIQKEHQERIFPSHMLISGDYKQARLRGSVTGAGRLMLPLIQKPTFLISPELMTLLSGGGEEKSSMINYFCEVLEEGIGRVGLVSMGNADISDETWETMKKRKITFNKQEATMYYRVEGTFMGASRPLKRSEFKYLSNSGFLDRISVVRWLHDRSEFEEQWMHVPQNAEKRESTLKHMNKLIWSQLHIDKLNYPPVYLINKCIKDLNDKYNDIEKQSGLPYFILRSARDSTNIAQLLTASSLARHLQTTGLRIPVLDFEDEDANLALSVMDNYANSRYQQAVEVDDINERYLTEWKFYNSLRESFSADIDPPLVDDVKTEIIRVKGCGESAAYKILQKWASKGWIRLIEPRVKKTNSKAVQFLK